MKPNTDNVGLNHLGVRPLTPEQMRAEYERLGAKENLRRSQQQYASQPSVVPSRSTNDLKVKITDPRLA
jgi:hypothetical protein